MQNLSGRRTALTGSGMMPRRKFIQATSLLGAALFCRPVLAANGSDRRQVDVCIYGANSGGIMAAITLARLGRSVLLVEPTRHVGGLTAAGLGWIDYGRASAIGGLTGEYFKQVRDYYTAAGIKHNGWSVEPHVAEMLFEKMLAKERIEVVREARISRAQMDDRRLRSITLDKAPVDPRGAPSAMPLEARFMTVTAGMFLDCSYEGDLLALAGVRYRTDREGVAEYGEKLAGVRYTPPMTDAKAGKTGRQKNKILKIDPFVRLGDPASGLIPLVAGTQLAPEGSQNPVIQAYNFRLCLTKDDPIPIAPPANYDPKQYELFFRYLDSLERVGEPLWTGDLYFNYGHERRYPAPRLLKITNLMRGKTDVNNAGFISTDYIPGGAEQYAKGDWPMRARIWHAHEDYQRGLFYYLRTGERLPEWLRREISQWGLPKDEFKDNGGWPTQLYVREARRMVGAYVIDQQHCEHPGSGLDSIGLGSYSLDSHVCQRLVRDGVVIHEGGFLVHDINRPYPIPYGAITPRPDECENLLVTFCVSSTHVAFASVRMEPVFMILSESAAFAADQALTEGVSVQKINLNKFRARLLAAGQILSSV
ncbi:MAG TPA: FAD-dependent oxidoreductase [Verrucomicrobiae bacterium]|jgi:hypothetical protein